MDAFIVSSPYQVLNSLQLCYPFKGKHDIFVLDQFAGCASLVDNLRKSGIFDNVIQVKNMTSKIRRRAEDFINRNFLYLFKAARFVDADRAYNKVYFAALDITVYMLMKYIKKCNPGMQIYRMEDGAGDYLSEGFMFSSDIDTCFHKLLGENMFLAEPEVTAIQQNTYLYEPGLICRRNRRENVKKLQNNLMHKDFLDSVNEVFQFREEYVPSAKVLFFDAGSNDSMLKLDENQKKAIQLLTSFFGKLEVGVKLHPRRKKNIYLQNTVWGQGNIPAEVYFANIQDCLSEKIIVAPDSTACLTPKIIFGAEPYLIFLYKIVYDDYYLTENMLFRYEEVVKKLDDLYCAKGRIFVPENISQLEEILQSLTAKE